MTASKNRTKKTTAEPTPVAKGKAKKGRAGLGMNNTWTDEPAAPEVTTPVEPATAESPATDPGRADDAAEPVTPEPAEAAPAEPPVAEATMAEPVEPAASPEPPPAPTVEADAPAKKLSALDAAARVLAEEGRPMNCQELIDAMATKGYWQSPGGKTPASTLYSAMLREQKVKGDQARFTKAERGKFTLAR